MYSKFILTKEEQISKLIGLKTMLEKNKNTNSMNLIAIQGLEEDIERMKQEKRTITSSGRTSQPPIRYDTLEFLPGANNGYTKKRKIDHGCPI